ncbi:MAG: hypothetical protein AAF772_08025 [Acidobacteriota bacterium]
MTAESARAAGTGATGTVLGVALVVLFALTTASGLALLFFVRPAPHTALDLADLHARGLGALHGLHRWSTHALLAVGALHALRAALQLRGPRDPRRILWLGGLALYALLVGLAATGLRLVDAEASHAAWALHVALLPLAAVLLTLDHLRRARRGGDAAPSSPAIDDQAAAP